MSDRTRRELLVAGAGAVAAATLVEASAAQAAGSHTPKLTAAQSQFAAMRIERLLRVELLMLFTYEHVLGSQILPERDRRCLQLRAEGLKYREIARILGISLGAVSISLSRSLARMTSAAGGDKA